MNRRAIHSLVLTLLIALSCSQSDSNSITQGGSETTNTYAVAVNDDSIHGTACASCNVGVYADSYSPVFDTGLVYHIQCDSAGRFAFSGVVPGRYSILIADMTWEHGALHRDVAVAESDLDTLITDTLHPTASLRGALCMINPMGDTIPLANASVYMRGSPFVTALDSLGGFSFDHLPAARYDFAMHIENSFSAMLDYTDFEGKLHELYLDAGVEQSVDTVYLREQ